MTVIFISTGYLLLKIRMSFFLREEIAGILPQF